MPFDKARRPVPASVGTIVITVKDIIGDPLRVMAQIQALDAGGQVVDTLHFNLWPHLSGAQQTGLTNLLSAIRTKATEVI